MDIYLVLDNCIIVPILSKLDSSRKRDFSFRLPSVEWAVIIQCGIQKGMLEQR